MNHLFIGAVVPLLAGALCYMVLKFRAPLWLLVLVPAAMAISMLWAVAPDLPRLFGMHDLYMKLYLDPASDLFYWHYSIDLVESDSNGWAVGLAAIVILMHAAALGELHRLEKGR